MSLRLATSSAFKRVGAEAQALLVRVLFAKND